MVDLVDRKPVTALARRMTARVVHTDARKRMAKLVAQAFLDEPRCARPLTEAERAAAPEWVRRKLERGGFVGAFAPDPDTRLYLQNCVRAVSAAAAEFAHLDALPQDASLGAASHLRAKAERLFAKIDHMPLDAIATQAGVLATERRRRLKRERDCRRRFPHHEIYAAPGRVWSRIVSVAELGRVGAELRNCLSSGSSRHQRYARLLRNDAARFWVLRDHANLARTVIMVATDENVIVESGGPGNAHIPPDDPDLAVLVKALNLTQLRARRRRHARVEDIGPRLAQLRAQVILPFPPQGA